MANGVTFDRTITLGTLIQLATILVMGAVGWTTIQTNQATVEREQAQQQTELVQLAQRQQEADELSARQAAILDGIDRRVGRIEQSQDRGK
jgi:uncharacterized protein HemX